MEKQVMFFILDNSSFCFKLIKRGDDRDIFLSLHCLQIFKIFSCEAKALAVITADLQVLSIRKYWN